MYWEYSFTFLRNFPMLIISVFFCLFVFWVLLASLDFFHGEINMTVKLPVGVNKSCCIRWITKSSIWMICSKKPIYLETKQVTVFMNESLTDNCSKMHLFINETQRCFSEMLKCCSVFFRNSFRKKKIVT